MKDLHELAKELNKSEPAYKKPESVYKSTSIYKWKQEGYEMPIKGSTDKGEHLIIGYRLVEIPEFDISHDEKANEKYIECLLRQKAFIDTIYKVFLERKDGLGSYLELRIENNRVTKTINCYLLLRHIKTNDVTYPTDEILAQEFKQLIPDDYKIKKLEKVEIKNILSFDRKHLVEIRKKNKILPVGSTYQYKPDGMEIARKDMIDWDGKKPFYIPCTSYIEPNPYNLSNLYKLLQNCTERVQIRISLGACNLFEWEKNLALQYYNMVKSTFHHVDTTEVNDVLKSFAKYISSSALFSLKMQVAAESEVVAMSIANSFCTQMSFGEIKAQTTLECFSLKDSSLRYKQFDWEECNHYFYLDQYPPGSFKEPDEAIVSFMRRISYLCERTEAGSAFRLPIANAEGMPGMVAKAIKPFYQPNPTEKPKDDLINLGNIITSSNAQHTMPYSLPLSDLTKHGLIVGAT